jgi:predicted phosphoribosyltransferase
VLLVDDGIATGSSMEAAARAARVRAPARIVIAAPVAAADTCQRLEAVADEVVCLSMPTPFYGVGAWYDDFTQTDDAEVRLLLRDAAARSGASP